MDEGGRLRKTIMDRAGAVRLGDTLGELMERRITPEHARFGPVAEAWSRLLPTELGRHCRIAGMGGGRLKVLVDSSSYMYELSLCRAELLAQLQHECPRAGLRIIKIAIG